jgi:hypothetical protein
MITATPDATDARVEKRLAELTKQRAARKEADDLPRSMTQRELNAYLAETTALDAQINALSHAAAAASFPGPTLDADVEWVAFLNRSFDAIGDERMTIKSPIKDPELKRRADDLGWSMDFIHRGFKGKVTDLPIVTLAPTAIGRLMLAAGYAVEGDGLRGPRGWRGSLPEVEARVKALTAEREKATAKLNALLVSDAERMAQEAEQHSHRAALATMNVTLNEEGTGLVAFTKDGDPLAVSDMTPEQRAAFERFEKATCP